LESRNSVQGLESLGNVGFHLPPLALSLGHGNSTKDCSRSLLLLSTEGYKELDARRQTRFLLICLRLGLEAVSASVGPKRTSISVSCF